MAGQRPNDLDRRIAARVGAARAAAGLTQRELGAAIGVTPAQLYKYERGTNRIAAAQLAVVAALTRTPIAAFYDPPADLGGAPDLTPAQAQHALVTAALTLAAVHGRTTAAAVPEAA